MATSSVNFVSALGTGSGVDIKTLAQNLVDAEKAPRQDLIQKRIDKNESRMSGYRTVVYGIDQLKTAVEALKSSQAFNNTTAQSSLSAVGVTVTGTPAPAAYQVAVSELAQGQRLVSHEFGSATAALNGDPPASFTFDLTVGTSSESITVNNPTPQGVVDAINQAGTGVTASLINVGSSVPRYTIVLNGPSGLANTFELQNVGSAVPLGFAAPGSLGANDRPARDATFTVDGLTIKRPSNRVTDVIDGVTLDLKATVSAGAPAMINLDRDVASVKEKIKAIVTAYNDLQSIIEAGFDPESKVEGLGGTLVGDVTARRIRDQVRRIMIPDITPTGASTALTGLRSLGIFIDTDNRMKFATLKDGDPTRDTLLQIGDESKLDDLLKDRFGDVADLFSRAVTGMGKDISDQLSGNGRYVDSLASPSSPRRLLLAGTDSATSRVKDDKERLAALEERMKGLLERYMKQFSVMDSLVGEAKSIRSGVENSFKGMSYSRN